MGIEMKERYGRSAASARNSEGRDAHAAFRTNKYLDKAALLDTTAKREAKERRRKGMACCLVLLVFMGVVASIGYYTVMANVAVPDNTDEFTVSEIRVGGERGTAEFADLCSYSLPVTIMGELPSSYKVPSFVKLYEQNPSITLTDTSTDAVLATSSDLTVAFTSATTFKVTTKFDFHEEETENLSKVVSKHMSGDLYTLDLNVDVVFEAYAFFLALDKFEISATKTITNVPGEMSQSEKLDRMANGYQDDLLVFLSDVTISKKTSNNVNISPLISLEFPSMLPMTMTLPPVTFEAQTKDGTKLANLKVEEGVFSKGVGDIRLNGFAESSTDVSVFDGDIDSLKFIGNGNPNLNCLLQDIMNDLEVTFSIDSSSDSSSDSDAPAPSSSSIDKISLKSISTSPGEAFDLFSTSTTSSLNLNTEVDFTLPISSSLSFTSIFPSDSFFIKVEDPGALSIEPKGTGTSIELSTITSTFSAAKSSLALNVQSSAKIDPRKDSFADLTGSALEFTSVDERLDALLKKFWDSSSSTIPSTPSTPSTPSSSSSSLSLKLSSFLDTLSLSTSLSDTFSLYDQSTLELPESVSSELLFNGEKVGNLAADILSTTSGFLNLTDAKVLSSIFNSMLSDTAFVQIIGDNLDLNISLTNPYSYLSSFSPSRRSLASWDTSYYNTTYDFDFPSSVSESLTSFIESVEILKVGGIDDTISTVEAQMLDLQIDSIAEIDFAGLFGVSKGGWLDKTFGNTTFEINVPPIDIAMFAASDMTNAAATMITSAIEWTSATSSKIFLDNTLAVHNKEGGLIDSLVATGNSARDSVFSFTGNSAPNATHFLSTFLQNVDLSMTFEFTLSSRRLAGVSPSELHDLLDPKAKLFLESYGAGEVEETGERKLSSTSYTGQESIGMKTVLSSPEGSGSSISLSNSLIVWPHLYTLPFTLISGGMEVDLKLLPSSLTGGSISAGTITIEPFSLTESIGGVVDVVFSIPQSKNDDMKSIITSFWEDGDSSSTPTFEMDGDWKTSTGQNKPFKFDFFKPKVDEAVGNLFSVVDRVRRSLSEEGSAIPELVKVDLVGGGQIGDKVTLPCVVPELCADELVSTAQSDFNVVITILAFDLPDWIMWGLELPDFSIDLECCTYTKLATGTLYGSSVDNSDKTRKNLAFSARTELLKPDTLYDSLKPIIDPDGDYGLEPVFRIHPSDEKNMLSYVFSGVEILIDPRDYVRRRVQNLFDVGRDLTTCEAAPLNNYLNFFHPTKCQDSWRVSSSSSDQATIEFDLLHPPLPVRMEFNNLDIQVKYESEKIYQVTTKNTMFAVGAAGCSGWSCPSQTIELTLFNTPALGKFNRRFMASGLEAVASPGTVDPLTWVVNTAYDTPCKPMSSYPYQCIFAPDGSPNVVRQQVDIEMKLFEQGWGGARSGSFGRRLGTSIHNCNPMYKDTACCNECVNDYTKMYSDFSLDFSESIYQSLDIWNGVDIVSDLTVCNILNFDVFVKDINVGVSLKDADGYDVWWNFGTNGILDLESDDEVPLVTVATNYDEEESGWRINSGNCSSSPSPFTTTLPTSGVELLARLYDESNKGRVCIQASGEVTFGFAAPGQPTFSWKQPIEIPTINVLGGDINVCADRSDCIVNTEVSATFNGGSAAADSWILNGGSIESGSGSLKLEKDSDGNDFANAWWHEKLDILDDWQLKFTVSVNSDLIAGAGFCVVLQNNDSGSAASSTTQDGFGYAGIDKSVGVCFALAANWWGSNKAGIFAGGVTTSAVPDEDESTKDYSYDVDNLDNQDTPRQITLRYEALTKLLNVYYDTAADGTVDEGSNANKILTAKIDFVDRLGFSNNFDHTTHPDGVYGGAHVGFTSEEDTSFGASRYTFSSFEMTTASTNLTMSFVEGQGRNHDLLSGSLYVDSRTNCATPLRSGGATFTSVVLEHADTGRKIVIDPTTGVTDKGTGRYQLDYVGCVGADLGWFEYCSDYDGKYLLKIDGITLGSVRLMAPTS